MNTWKLSIKPKAQKNYNPFKFCMSAGLVGVGWSQAYADKPAANLEEAKQMVKAKYGKWFPALKILFERMQPNDHVWLHQGGHYYLCKVGSKFRFGADVDDDFLALDLGHCRDAEWVRVPEKFVSGDIQRGTIAQRMTQAIKIPPEIFKCHQVLFDELKKDPLWEPNFSESSFESQLSNLSSEEILSITTPDDLEDIVAAYLQGAGWMLIKSTCFRSKSTFEFMMRNCKNETCLVQVKSGKKPNALKPEKYQEYVVKDQSVYLLSTHSNAYPGKSVAGVETINPEELVIWLKANVWAMTDALKLRIWLVINTKS